MDACPRKYFDSSGKSPALLQYRGLEWVASHLGSGSISRPAHGAAPAAAVLGLF
jgi:hypothetical protein